MTSRAIDLLQSALLINVALSKGIRAVPFNIVHGSGVTAQKFGLEGEGCQLEIYVEKQWGEGGHRPKFEHDYTENVKNLGWRGRGVGMENF